MDRKFGTVRENLQDVSVSMHGIDEGPAGHLVTRV
jgi:hypothetical protein